MMAFAFYIQEKQFGALHKQKSINDEGKSRIKERTIQEVIQKVSLWRLLYTGFHNKNGAYIKMSLEEAAQKVKISKKSLDDYLMQLRSAKKFGFDFDKHNNDKVGVIRSFVRKKKEEERKRISKPLGAIEDAVSSVGLTAASIKTPKSLKVSMVAAKSDLAAKGDKGFKTRSAASTHPVRKCRK